MNEPLITHPEMSDAWTLNLFSFAVRHLEPMSGVLRGRFEDRRVAFRKPDFALAIVLHGLPVAHRTVTA